MASTAYSSAALTALQTRYTAAKNGVTAMVAAGNRTAAAAHAADLQELQLVTTREGGSPLA